MASCVVWRLNTVPAGWLWCVKHSLASGGRWGAHSGVTGSVAEEKAQPCLGWEDVCDDVAPLSGNVGL